MNEKRTVRTAAEWFEEGRRCFHKPDGVGAVNAMQRVIDMDPAFCHSDGDNPYFYLGKISEMEDRLNDAVMFYTRALSVNSLDEESLIGRGSCYTVLKQHDLAVFDFSKVLQFPDEKRRAPRKYLLYAIAENYRQMEAWDQALHWGRLALEADPENSRHRQLMEEISEKVKD